MATPDLRNLRRDRARQSTRLPRWARLLIVLAGLYLLYVVLGFLLAPGILKHQLEERASVQLKRPVTVGKVYFNPITLTVAVEDLRVEDHDKQTLLSWKRLFVNLQFIALLRDEIHLAEIDLDGFSSRLFVSKEGVLNVADLLGEKAAPTKSSKQWVLRIDHLSVGNAELDYTDNSRSEPFHTHVGPTTFALRDFRTAGGPGAPGYFSASTEAGETVEWTGRLALAPLHSNGELRLKQIALKKYAPFYDGLIHFDVANGLVDVQAPYEFLIQNNQPELKIIDAGVHLRDLEFAERGSKGTFFSLKTLDVEPLAADLQASTLDVGKIILSEGELSVLRDHTGINLTRLLPPSSASAATAPSAKAPASAAWTIKLGEIGGKNFAVDLTDQTIPHPTTLRIQKIEFSAKHLSSRDLATPVPIYFQAYLPDGKGTLALSGQVAPQPLSADLNASATAVALATFAPWAENLIAGRLTGGSFQLHSHIKVSPSTGPLRLEASADADVNDVALADANGQPVAQWKALGVHGVDYTSSPERLGVTEVALTDPVFSLAMGKDHLLNVMTLMGTPAAPPAVKSAAPALKSAPSQRFVSIDRIVLNNANITFVDQSIDPAVKTSVSELSGTITGLTSAAIDHGDLEFKGKIDGAAPLGISGTTNLLSDELSADLKLSVQNSSLLPLGPYVGRFVGYELSSGGLTLESHAKVVQRKLDSTSSVVVTNFALGASTNSPVAPHVPIHLALALLKDSQGRIVLNLPVQGSLDDPSFQIGGVVWKLIEGLIVKAATSPFSLIGSVFGHGHPGDDLSFQEFAAGSSDLADQDPRKLDVVAKALHDRPALHLIVHGASSATVDLPPIREQAFTHRLQAAIYEESKGIDANVKTADQVVVGAAAEARLIAKWYQAEFIEQPKPVDKVAATSTEPAKKHFFLIRWLYKNPEPAPVKEPAKKLPSSSPAKDQGPEPVLPPLAEMRARLLATMPIGDSVLADLAKQRAENVQRYIVSKGELTEDRVSVGPNVTQNPTTRVQLELQ